MISSRLLAIKGSAFVYNSLFPSFFPFMRGRNFILRLLFGYSDFASISFFVSLYFQCRYLFIHCVDHFHSRTLADLYEKRGIKRLFIFKTGIAREVFIFGKSHI
jgi:hypothetical protein